MRKSVAPSDAALWRCAAACAVLQAYFNDNALTLIRTMITGGATPQLELILAEGVGMRPGHNSIDTLAKRDRCRVAMMNVYEPPLDKFFTASHARYSSMS